MLRRAAVVLAFLVLCPGSDPVLAFSYALPRGGSSEFAGAWRSMEGAELDSHLFMRNDGVGGLLIDLPGHSSYVKYRIERTTYSPPFAVLIASPVERESPDIRAKLTYTEDQAFPNGSLSLELTTVPDKKTYHARLVRAVARTQQPAGT